MFTFVLAGQLLGGLGHGILGINLDPTMLAIVGGVYGAYKGTEKSAEKEKEDSSEEAKGSQKRRHEMELAELRHQELIKGRNQLSFDDFEDN